MIVLKWRVPVDDDTHPIGAGRVLLVGSQGEHGTVCVWTLERNAVAVPSVQVIAVGTGQKLPARGNWEHIGSAQAGPFVWHVFEDVKF